MNRRGFLRGLVGGGAAIAVGGVSVAKAAVKALAEIKPAVVKRTSSSVIGLNDPRAVKRWAAMLARDARYNSYFTRKFCGESPAPIKVQRLTSLESE